MKNALKEKLAANQPVLGTYISFPSPDVVEVCSYLGFDFVVLDTEHGAIGVESIAHLLRAAECANVTPIVNVPVNSPHIIARYLDMGALGIQVPQVNSRQEAEAIVRAVKYHPLGQRGMARRRAGQYGVVGSLQEYMETANRETMIIASIENVEGLVHLPELLTVEGIDIFFVGPSDLSQSLGMPGQLSTPLVKSSIDTIISQVRAAGRIVGIPASDAASARAYIAKGAQYIMTSTESILSQGARAYLQETRRS